MKTLIILLIAIFTPPISFAMAGNGDGGSTLSAIPINGSGQGGNTFAKFVASNNHEDIIKYAIASGDSQITVEASLEQLEAKSPFILEALEESYADGSEWVHVNY